TLTFADLAGLSVNEIALISNSKQQTSGEISVSQTGTVSTKAYIGRDEALAAACAHAGVQTEDLLQTEVEFDSENGVMVYEVEFRVG
ncbi:MAG TPA: cell wall protein, partial [Clostridiales bacterium]|nr:cell wall protein [Clostridiales bacterium]